MARNGLIGRALLLGVAGGLRSSVSLAGPTLTSPTVSRAAKTAALLAVLGELSADKLPTAPPRTQPAGLAPRFGGAASGAVALARRQDAGILVPAAVAVVGAALGSFGGVAWRRWSATSFPDWQGALAEDATAITLALVASRT